MSEQQEFRLLQDSSDKCPRRWAFVLETQNKKASDIKHSEPLTENTIIDRLYSPRAHGGRNTERNDRLGGYTAL